MSTASLLFSPSRIQGKEYLQKRNIFAMETTNNERHITSNTTVQTHQTHSCGESDQLMEILNKHS